MKIKYVLGLLAVLLVALALSAVACGGDDDDDGSVSEIRTQKGLTAANIDQFGGVNAESDDNADADLADGGAAPTVDVAIGAEEGIDRLGSGFAPSALQQQAGTSGGLTVQGYGTATADADSAIIEFYFGRYSEAEIRFDEPVPPDTDGGSSGSSGSDDGDIAVEIDADVKAEEVAPITEDDLQPVIDALESAGADVEFVEQSYYDPYYASATLRATVNDLDAIEEIVEAGNNASGDLEEITLQSSNVMYTVSDCSALQQAALETAIEDAGDNAEVFAAALGVTAGEMIGATNYSYFAEDDGSCSSYWGYYPVYEDASFIGGPAEVSVYAQVAITYAMQ